MSPVTTALRFLAGIALVGLMVAFFYEPLSRALERFSVTGKDTVWDAEPAAIGEALAPSAPPSFLLQVFSTPPRARVMIDGQERGTTPAVTNIPCRSGQIVEVIVDLAGHRRWQRQLPCLPGESAALEVKLDRF
jgi:hypothetical protein